MDTNDRRSLTNLILAIGVLIIVAALTSAIWTTNARIDDLRAEMRAPATGWTPVSPGGRWRRRAPHVAGMVRTRPWDRDRTVWSPPQWRGSTARLEPGRAGSPVRVEEG